MKSQELVENCSWSILALIMIGSWVWAVFINVRAVVKQEFRNPVSGEIYTGPEAVRAGLIRATLFIAFFVLVVIYFLNK